MCTSDGLTIRPLLIEEAELVYNTYMIGDFPKNELKLFGMIRAGVQEGTYLCLAAFDGPDFVGYAFFVYGPGEENSRHVLLDYLAVVPEKRGEGYGSRILKKLRIILPTAGDILIEIEDPDHAADEAEAAQMEKRQSFYLNAGVGLTGVRSTVYGVHYRILVLSKNGKNPADEEVEKEISGIYHSIFPDAWWENGLAEVTVK